LVLDAIAVPLQQSGGWRLHGRGAAMAMRTTVPRLRNNPFNRNALSSGMSTTQPYSGRTPTVPLQPSPSLFGGDQGMQQAATASSLGLPRSATRNALGNSIPTVGGSLLEEIYRQMGGKDVAASYGQAMRSGDP